MGRKITKPNFNWNIRKLYARLLSDEDFLTQVQKMLQKVLEVDNKDIIVKLEDIKNSAKIAAFKKAGLARHCEKQKEKVFHDQPDFLTRKVFFPEGTKNK